MAAETGLVFEGTFNNVTTGLYKDNTTNDISEADLRALPTAVKESYLNRIDDAYTGAFPQVTATGTDTYAATLAPIITAYATGQKFQIKFTNASSGVSTLNLNAVGAKKIFVNPTTQATVAHIVAGQISLLVYDADLDAAAGGFLMIGAPTVGGGTVTSVSGTTNRITSTGGATPAIDISATFEALLGKIAQRIDQNNSATTSAQLAATISDETGSGALVFASGPTLAGTPTTPTAAPGTNNTQVASTAYADAAVAAGLSAAKSMVIAVTDEVTNIGTGTGKVSFRMPYAMTLTAVRASLVVAQASGSIFTVDINEAGTTILSTKLTIDNTETTSVSAATPPVISDTALADDAIITVDVDQIGNGSAIGLKITLIGT